MTTRNEEELDTTALLELIHEISSEYSELEHENNEIVRERIFMNEIEVTKEEQKAIASLERLAKKWPRSLQLFSWSGSLCVFKVNKEGVNCEVTNIGGIPNDGGDPDADEVDQFAEVNYL